MKLILHDSLTLFFSAESSIPKSYGIYIKDRVVVEQKITLAELEMIRALWWLHHNTKEFYIANLKMSVEDCIVLDYRS